VNKKVILLSLIAGLIGGCYNSSFKPATSKLYPQIVDSASIIYKNDFAEFAKCSIVELGTVEAGGNSFVNHDDVADYAAKIAAERGATHIIIASTYTAYVTSETTSCYGNSNYVNCNTSQHNYPKPRGVYVALRIDCHLRQ
jgi:hypothetical protein